MGETFKVVGECAYPNISVGTTDEVGVFQGGAGGGVNHSVGVVGSEKVVGGIDVG